MSFAQDFAMMRQVAGSPVLICVKPRAAWTSIPSGYTFDASYDAYINSSGTVWKPTSSAALNAADIQFGVAGATDAFIAATAAAGKGGAGLAAGEVWCDNSPAETYGNTSTLVLDKIVSGGLDVGYEITGAALTGGVLEFHCVWVPLSSDGLVEAGAGGTL